MRNILVLVCILFLFIACAPQTYSTRPADASKIILHNVPTVNQPDSTQTLSQPAQASQPANQSLALAGTCTDTDSGNDQTKKGILTLKTQDNTTIVEDTCINKEILLEQYCKLGQKFTDKILCEKNCKEGACL